MLHSHQVDMINAFFNSHPTKRIYIDQPEYFHNENKNHVFLLFQWLYSLKQAAHLWFDSFKEKMQKLGFVPFYYDSALYLNNNKPYFALYVDDLHIVGLDLPLIMELKKQLAAKFKTTNLGPTSHYLGMELLHKDHIITITKTVFFHELLAANQISDCNSVYTPMV